MTSDVRLTYHAAAILEIRPNENSPVAQGFAVYVQLACAGVTARDEQESLQVHSYFEL
jgi:hypothetical protein